MTRIAVACLTVAFATACSAQEFASETDTRISKPSYAGDGFRLPELVAPSIATADIGDGNIPVGFRSGVDAPIYRLPESAAERDANWAWTLSHWAAPNTFSKPRYFEDRMLERHGHTRWGKLQPAASGARFFATVAMLPYLMTLQHPSECEYTLGYYRSGSRTPALLQRPPYDRRAAIVEAAAVAGAIIAFP